MRRRQTLPLPDRTSWGVQFGGTCSSPSQKTKRSVSSRMVAAILDGRGIPDHGALDIVVTGGGDEFVDGAAGFTIVGAQ
jgi:hypothetical protein